VERRSVARSARALLLVLGATSLPPSSRALAQSETTDATKPADFWTRDSLTGSWGGLRDTLAEHGLSANFAVTYTFQGVTSGGFDGPLFDRFSDEGDTGQTLSGDLALALDTEKAGWWSGGTVDARADARTGRSVLQRTGTVSAVDNDALFPNVVDRFDETAGAITALTYTQHVVGEWSVFGGLLNTAEGDENALAGSALSNAHFLNSAMLYSLVEDATVPNSALGGGASYESERLSGSLSVFGTEETAGRDPFEHTHGTTFSTEWTLSHTLHEHEGAQTLGVLYGIDTSRTDIAADPRLVLGNVLSGQAVPSSSTDTWAVYYNAHQYLEGDADRGFGTFVRFGLSDGDANPVKWNAAGGLAGKGVLPSRPQDTWGLGGFYLGVSHADLLEGLGVDDEFGGELFYTIAVAPWFRVTLDAQGIDPALPGADTAWVLGVRVHVTF
jgi:porin